MELIEEKKDLILIFHFKGRFDNNTSSIVEKKILETIAKGSKFLIFSFADVSYLSSAGIRSLVQFYKKIEHEKGKIYLTNVSKPIENILYITGFLPYFQLFATIDEAYTALSKIAHTAAKKS